MKLMMNALKRGNRVPDEEFDRIFPEYLKKISDVHWTPVDVAKHAAELLVTSPGTRVLDVGSGCGKFCLVGSLTTTGQFYGIEQRSHLVEVAKNVAEKLEVKSSTFLQGDIRDINWSDFESFYLFNPFVENIYPGEDVIDKSVDQSVQAYKEHIRWVQQSLHTLPVGTRVATYHGFGGDFPPGYQLFAKEAFGEDFLRLWVKVK